MLTLISILACTPDADDSASGYSTAELDEMGEALAAWSDWHGVSVKINDLPVNVEGANPGGNSPVFWDWGDEPARVETHRANLETVLTDSSCDAGFAEDYLRALAPESPDSGPLSDDLACLGEFTFTVVEWSSE